jgi:L-alanine-DL-glutamate epimerase-like enolase superfamily enzyme
MEMVAPRWAGRMTKTVVSFPSRRQVEQAIGHLDGKQLNDLYLNTSDSLTYLGVCGGAGRYMVTLTEHHERFAQLLNTQDSSNTQEEQIMCGGQLTRFPRRHLVDLQTAVTAAIHYLDTGQAAPTLSWEWHS